jgi:tellurite resistance-related uncharacterized protein
MSIPEHAAVDETNATGLNLKRHLDAGTRQGVYPRLSVMQGAIRYLGYADETSPDPLETLTIAEGEFGVSARKWHRIEALTEDTVFNVDFYVDPTILIRDKHP